MVTRWPRALARGTVVGAAATAGMILWLAANHWTEPRKWSIVGAPFLASLFLATATLVAGSWLLHRWFTRWGLRLGATVLALTFVAAIINAHFGYLPTVDTLLGRCRRKAASSSSRCRERFRASVRASGRSTCRRHGSNTRARACR